MSETGQVDMAQARGTYRTFTKIVLWAIIGIVLLLIVMAFFLV